MNILFINRFYYPDSGGTGKTLTELAVSLANQNFKVAILTSDTAAYDTSQKYMPHEISGGVEIHRVRATRFNQRTILGWGLNAIMFYPVVLLKLLRLPRQDVNVFLTDPPLIFVLGPMIRFIKGTKFVCWSQDVYPDVAVRLGVLQWWSPIAFFCRFLAGWALRCADLVIVLGETMKARLIEKGVHGDRIAVIHVWADRNVAWPVKEVDNWFLSKYGLEGKFVVSYSGNMGLSHEFSTVLDAARLLNAQKDIVWLFIGEGKQFENIKKDSKDIRAIFMPFQPEDYVAYSLSAATIHVVTLKSGLEGLLVPKKLYGALAVARPVIFVGGHESEVAKVIDSAKCGVTVEPGDVGGFVAAIKRMQSDPRECKAMGQRGYDAFVLNYELKVGTKRVRDALDSLRRQRE